MLYTIVFYLILFIVVKNSRGNYTKAIKAACMVIAIYLGLRYDYCPDYSAYQMLFEMFTSPNFEYTEIVHVEYGWYLINKWCEPIGYFGFVFLTSCIFAYGIYLLMSIYVKSIHLVLITIWGIVSAGGFTTLLSAQRQMLVTAIFMIAYRYILYERIHGKFDILKFRTLIYFTIISLCSCFHRSAIFLLVIPFIFLLPKRSNTVILGIFIIGIAFILIGDTMIAPMFQSLAADNDFYDYINFSNKYAGTVTFLQGLMWILQVYYLLKVYKNNNMETSEMAAVLLSLFAILITLSGYYLNQVGRIAHYIYIFTFLSIAIVVKYNKKNDNKIYLLANYIWIVWNLLKVFTINVGTYQEYKTIFKVLL